MSKESDVSTSVGGTRSGALWGAGIFFVLWLAMLGTVGEILLLLPALYVIGIILDFLGVATQESMLWRGVAAIVSAAVFAFIGVRCGPSVFSAYAKLPRRARIAAIVFLAILFFMTLLIGRNLRIH